MRSQNLCRWTITSILVSGIFLGICSAFEDGYTLLDIPQGRILGKVGRSRAGRTFTGFMGIPYAQPPERFESAKLPPPTWSNIYDGTKYGEICLQSAGPTPTGSEDCLFVNVFTPNVTGNMSVLAYTHGGAFMVGSSNGNGPDFFMDHDVVYVSFNYRLAAFGFLSTGDDTLPGNFGLKDQNLALRWIQDNIEYFGGDKSRVTLMGGSAGGVSVALQVVSPQSRGLFRHAICQSAAAHNLLTTTEEPLSSAVKLAARLNCPTAPSRDMIDCLKEKPARDIVSVELREDTVLESPTVFGPVLDPEFMPDYPRNLYERGEISKVPLMLTLTDFEGLMINSVNAIYSNETIDAFNSDWTRAASTAFLLDKPSYSQEAIKYSTDKLREFYFGASPVGNETFLNLTDLYSDSYFVHGVRRTSLAHAQYAPVYTNVMGFKGIWSQTFALGFMEILGMTHGDDLFYLFTSERYPQIPPGSESEDFSKLLVQLTVNFANSGDPNYQLNGRRWLPLQQEEIDTEVIDYLYLKNEPEFVKGLFGERMALWDHLDEVLESGVIP